MGYCYIVHSTSVVVSWFKEQKFVTYADTERALPLYATFTLSIFMHVFFFFESFQIQRKWGSISGNHSGGCSQQFKYKITSHDKELWTMADIWKYLKWGLLLFSLIGKVKAFYVYRLRSIRWPHRPRLSTALPLHSLFLNRYIITASSTTAMFSMLLSVTLYSELPSGGYLASSNKYYITLCCSVLAFIQYAFEEISKY